MKRSVIGMAKTNTIITIGRQFGSAGREIGYQSPRTWILNYMTRRCWTGLRKRAAYARSYSRLTTKNQPTVFIFPGNGHLFSGLFLRKLHRYAD